jgi:hypothetical protein
MNFKLSGIAAGAAFVFSLLIGLISGAGFLALFRAFIFAAVFWVISGGACWLIRRFLPELFEAPGNGSAKNFAPGEAPPAGSLVDISLGDDDGRGNVLDVDVEDYISSAGSDHSPISGFEGFSGLDQKGNNGYTIGGDIKENSIVTEDGGESVLPSLPGTPDNFSGMESLSTAFPSGGAKRGGGELSVFVITPGGSAGKKSAGGVGDLASEFDARDMASAIQTIIKRE